MRRIVILSLLIVLIQSLKNESKAQNLGVMITTGIATFQMDDMKSYQAYLLSRYPVEGQIISSFPAYASSSVNLVKQPFPKLRIGAGYTFTSTGGKSDYSDFSGNIHTTIITNSHRLGAYIYYSLRRSDHYDLGLFGRLGANMGRVETTTIISASGLSNGISEKFKSTSPNVHAGAEILRNFKDISVGLDMGYLVDFPGELSGENGGNLYDPINPAKVLSANWSGLRANLKIIFWLKR